MRAKSAGVTLIELLVVVAIVAVMSAVGVANYNSYVARSRTAQAKVNLAAIYTAERNFFANSFSYTLCLNQLGYQPNFPDPYYYVGFMNGGGTTCGPLGNFNCNAYDFTGTAPAGASAACSCATVAVDGNGISHTDCYWLPKIDIDPATALNMGYAWVAVQSTFIAGAEGKINFGKLDTWTMDQTKKLSNPVVGQ